MSLVVRAFPLRASTSELQRFVQALQGERRDEAQRFYREHGVTHESWHLQETDHGPWVIGLTQVENAAESAPRFAAAQSGFAGWFKDQVRTLSGVDTSIAPLGPPTRLVYQWSDRADIARAFAPPQL